MISPSHKTLRSNTHAGTCHAVGVRVLFFPLHCIDQSDN